MTPSEAAHHLGVGDAWLRQLIRKGRLKARKVGRDWSIDPHDLKALKRRQRAPVGLQLTHDGRTQSLAAWAQETGLTRRTIRNRLKAGWSVGDVLTRAVHPGRRAKEGT
jgi:excisionase family DNA binding protein